MAVSFESLSSVSSVCERAQNCGIGFRPNSRRAISERGQNCGISFRSNSRRTIIGTKKCKFLFRINCSGRGRHGGGLKHYSRQPFRSSSVEDDLITSWVLYKHHDVKPKSIPSKPTSPGYENSQAVADDNQTTSFVADAQGKKGRRNSRVGNPSLSLSQSFDVQTSSGYIIGATGPPATLSKPFAGGAGLYMALVFALLGITTAGASLLGMNSSQEECTKCSGYGVERCHLCQSTGTLKCELDTVHYITCPLCFGSLTKKCSSCDGVRMRKGVPPFLQ